MANRKVASLTATVTIKFNKRSFDKLNRALDKLEDQLKNIVTLSKMSTSNLQTMFNRSVGSINKARNAGKQFNNEMNRGLTNQVKNLGRVNTALANFNRKKTIAGGGGGTGGGGPANPFFEPGVGARAYTPGGGGGILNAIFRVGGRLRTQIGIINSWVSNFAKITTIVPLASGLFLTLATRVNKTTTEMLKLSKVTGVSMEWMQGMTVLAKELGFNFENVNSLVEELNNKVGGQLAGFDEINLLEGLKQLGLTFQDIEKLKPEEQFNLIAKRTQEMARGGMGIQQIASAWDKIFGGEGNRIGANIATMEEDFEKIQKRMEKISGLSNNAQRGAQRFTKSMNELTALAGKFVREFFGRFGLSVVPTINDFIEFLITNMDEITAMAGRLAQKTADIFVNILRKGKEVIEWALENEDLLQKNLQTLKEWARILIIVSEVALKIAVNFGAIATPANAMTVALGFTLTKLLKIKGVLMIINQLSKGRGMRALAAVMGRAGTGKGIAAMGTSIKSMLIGAGVWIKGFFISQLPTVVAFGKAVFAKLAAVVGSGPFAPAVATAIVGALLYQFSEYFFPGFIDGMIDSLKSAWESVIDWLSDRLVPLFSMMRPTEAQAKNISQHQAPYYDPRAFSSNTTNNVTNNIRMSGMEAALEVRKLSGGSQ
jgi:methyl-accepting chemotaxis protein